MKVVDKEQEKREQENDPEVKRKKLRSNILQGIGIVAILGVLAWLIRSPLINGEPFVVSVDGREIIPGKTTVQEVIGNGYEVGMFDIYGSAKAGYEFFPFDSTEMLEKRTYIYAVALTKDSERVATLEICNFKNKDIPLSEGVITDISFNVEKDIAKVEVDGRDISEYSLDNLASLYGDKLEEKSNGYVVKDKYYKLTFELGDEKELKNIKSNYDKNS